MGLSGCKCVLLDAHSHYNTPPYSELKLVSVLAMAEVNARIVKLQNRQDNHVLAMVAFTIQIHKHMLE